MTLKMETEILTVWVGLLDRKLYYKKTQLCYFLEEPHGLFASMPVPPHPTIIIIFKFYFLKQF